MKIHWWEAAAETPLIAPRLGKNRGGDAVGALGDPTVANPEGREMEVAGVDGIYAGRGGRSRVCLRRTREDRVAN